MDLNDKLRTGGARLGNIFFGIAATATVMTLFTAFSPLMMAFYLLMLLVLILITLGTIFIMVEDFGSFFSGSAQAYGSFTESAIKAMPYLAAVAVVAAAAAIILLMLDVRTKKHTSKIAGAVVCIVLSIVFALLSKAVMK